MIAAHNAGPLTRISPSSAILTSVPGNSQPTVPNRYAAGRLRNDAADVSDSPYPLEHLDADRVEPLCDVVVQRGGGSGDEEAQPAAEPFPDGREHEFVGDLVLHRIQRRR